MGSRIGYIGGTFDLFHLGHAKLISTALNNFEKIIIAVNPDDFCERFKRKPVMSFTERVDMICAFVGQKINRVTVIENTGRENTRETITQQVFQKLKKDDRLFIIHGDDWTGDSYLKQLNITNSWLEKKQITLWYLPYTKEISTTEIINRIKCAKN